MRHLGFSDLTENEALLVAIYRDCVTQGAFKNQIEAAFSKALAQDVLHSVLDDVFAIFRQMSPDTVYVFGKCDLLSEHEERLLDDLSEGLNWVEIRDRGMQPIVRPVAEISLSGKDEMMFLINLASYRFSLGC
jgi:hypothetical protein